MKNINGYDILQCQEYCKRLPFFNQLQSDFDHLSWSNNDPVWSLCNRFEDGINLSDIATPREYAGTIKETFFSMVPFYYLKELLEKNPSDIYDLGCGWNIFKKYIPNIIGVSPKRKSKRPEHFAGTIDNMADVHGFIDKYYIATHQKFFESVFSINALHFRIGGLAEFEKIVTDFASMIKPGGRGFLALNLARLITFTPDDFLKSLNGEYDHYVRTILQKINLNYIILDVDFENMDCYMDGNIKIVFEK
jgi:hypothetical protein